MELKITVKQAVPLALLYEADGHEVEGKTRMQKLAFLTQERLVEAGVDLYEFIEYDYGPFSKELLEDLEMYEQKGLVEINRVPTFSGNHRFDYSLTEEGVEVFEGLLNENDTAKEVVETASSVLDEYNDLSIRALMEHIYENFPRFQERSVYY